MREVEDKIPRWLKTNHASEEAGTIVLDLQKLGYQKLLSTGKLTKKIKVTIPTAVKKAEEKIKAAGGEILVNE